MEIGENNQTKTFGIENLSIIKNNSNLQVSIEINIDELCFSIINSKYEIIRIEQYNIESESIKTKINKIEKIIISNKFLKQNFQDYTLILNHEFFTLIPKKLFNTKNYIDYYHFCFSENKEDEIIFEDIENINSVNIYSINKALKNVLLNYFPKIKIRHTGTNLIKSLSEMINQNQNIFLNINKTNFQIVFFEKNNLSLYNYFHYNTEEDFLFYFLYISKELKIDQENSNIFISGEIYSKSRIIILMKNYFQNINFLKIKNTIDIPFFFQNLDKHNFYNLLNGHLCE